MVGNEAKCVKVVSKKGVLFDDKMLKPKKYVYDYVFDETTGQEDVYKLTTAPLVRDVLNGMNAAAFAYGATGSGKTHTMLGPNPKKATTPASESQQFNALKPHDGLMLRAVWDIFEFVEGAEKKEAFTVSGRTDGWSCVEGQWALKHPFIPRLPCLIWRFTTS